MSGVLYKLWQCLAHDSGFHEVVALNGLGPDSRAFLPVTDFRLLELFALGRDGAGRGTLLSAVPRASKDSLGVGAASVVWARLESGAGAAQLQRFTPAPTFVLREGRTVQRVAIWALLRPLTYEWTMRANRRLAHRLDAKKKHGAPEFMFTPPGASTETGRSVWVEFESDGLYMPAEVVGRLPDAPDPDAWRDREAA